MRKIWFLAFFLLIFFFSFNIFFVKSDLTFAQLNLAVASSESAQKVNYDLPYPGLLPDSPIYFLKIIRDKTISFLISNPLKKAEFDLLQADKRLNAGIYLFNSALLNDSAKQNEKKIKLAVSTISKAENYFEQALGKAREARQEGIDIREIAGKLINSAKKHQEEIDALVKKSAEGFRGGFDLERKRTAAFEKQAEELISKR